MEQEKNNQLATTTSKPPFWELLKSDKKGDIAERLLALKQNGQIDFKAVLAIDFNQRIPQLTKDKEGRDAVLIALSVALRNAMKNFNVKYAMTADQIVELAYAIIDQSHEDQLSLEDIVLFLQKMVLSEYGEIEFKLDMPFFFKCLEVYRQERHEALTSIRNEQHINYRAMGMERQGNLTWGDLLHKTANLKK